MIPKMTRMVACLAVALAFLCTPAGAQTPVQPAPARPTPVQPSDPDADGGPQVFISIDPGASSKIPIAIPDFQPITPGGGGSTDAAQGLPKRLQSNLDLTGMFYPLDKRTFLEMDSRAGLGQGQPVVWREWVAIGSELLVKGGYAVSGNTLTLELRLYNVLQQTMPLGKRYTGALGDGRKMINRFTNEILFVLTGEPGVFGSKIAFVSGTRSEKRVMLTEFGSDEVTQVSGSGGPANMPTVSPSGAVAYVQRNGKSYELRVGGTVIASGPLYLSPAYTPGGALLAAISGRNDTNIFSFGGGKPSPVTNNWGINISPTISPDGSMMAFVSDRSGPPQIYVSSIGGGTARRLTSGGKGNTDPNWSPKGDRIAFCGSEKDVVIISPTGSGQTQLTGGAGVNTRPTFSPDGRLIVFASTRNGRSELFVMAANGDRQLPLMPDYKGDQRSPYWSPVKPEFDPGQ